MAKNILAFFGMVFLTIIVIVGVGMMGYLYDALGLVALPKDFSLASLYQPDAITIVAAEEGLEKGTWSNPLEMLPVVSTTPMSTATFVPMPTLTPVPPLDPLVYRTEVVIRLKHFVSALEVWLEVNDQLVLDNTLISDPTWRSAVELALNNVTSASRAMADIGPAPAGHEAIDVLLDRVQLEAEGLQQNYQQALANGGAQYFTAAGENFSRLKSYLTEAVEAMLAMGWKME